MDYRGITKSRQQALKFIARCDEVMKEFESNSLVLYTGSKKTGELRRASMDLTRSLSDLRRSKNDYE